MSDRLAYLFFACLVLWGAVAIYLWRLASLRHDLEARVKRLEGSCPASDRPGPDGKGG